MNHSKTGCLCPVFEWILTFEIRTCNLSGIQMNPVFGYLDGYCIWMVTVFGWLPCFQNGKSCLLFVTKPLELCTWAWLDLLQRRPDVRSVRAGRGQQDGGCPWQSRRIWIKRGFKTLSRLFKSHFTLLWSDHLNTRRPNPNIRSFVHIPHPEFEWLKTPFCVFTKSWFLLFEKQTGIRFVCWPEHVTKWTIQIPD